MIKDYLKTFKPVDFESGTRLIASLIFTFIISVLFFLMYGTIGLKNPYPIFTNFYYLSILSVTLGLLFFLSVDNSGGFGRDYVSKHGWRNFLIFMSLWIIFCIFNFLFFNF